MDNQNCVKPDKVEPKFHEGDFIVDPYCRGKIIALTSDAYLLDTGQGVPFSCEDSVHLWTIQDAKDGDVLACGEEILLFKSYSVQGRISLYCWYNGQTNNFHNKEGVDVLLTTRNKVCPATKEQRDLLFQKMAEAGYKWDANKKELKKIKMTDLVKDYNRLLSIKWSEYDSAKLQACIDSLQAKCLMGKVDTVLTNWLKSLKERIGE